MRVLLLHVLLLFLPPCGIHVFGDLRHNVRLVQPPVITWLLYLQIECEVHDLASLGDSHQWFSVPANLLGLSLGGVILALRSALSLLVCL